MKKTFLQIDGHVENLLCPSCHSVVNPYFFITHTNNDFKSKIKNGTVYKSSKVLLPDYLLNKNGENNLIHIQMSPAKYDQSLPKFGIGTYEIINKLSYKRDLLNVYLI